MVTEPLQTWCPAQCRRVVLRRGQQMYFVLSVQSSCAPIELSVLTPAADLLERLAAPSTKVVHSASFATNSEATEGQALPARRDRGAIGMCLSADDQTR
ncbi:hypothetical protein CQ13_35300 [Bradyrhizobium retamae]|uniref:Uncharacterized protein n=1 Tax=Bradyrhizobium retamae TaxID=1300035 RepID=A0A0R3MEA3_9BRAD|nr:hypothetical protein CQ13_35300 [Bradyrhizobium retamae]